MLWQRTHETIAAVASPAGPGARLIIRISGPEAWRAVTRVLCREGQDFSQTPQSACVFESCVSLGDLSASLPCLVYLWPEGHSFTGQMLVELHTVYSQPLAEKILNQLSVRLAQPGEFTLRAFLSGRLDLTQAEAVLGVVQAQTDQELQVALRQLAGGLSGPLRTLREELLNLVADVEAGLDFAEEDHPFLSPDELLRRLAELRRQLEQVHQQVASRRAATELPRVVLAGPPNAGKSTLFNALCNANRAIVSPIAGTTRDYLSAICHHQGMSFELIDTAGVAQRPAVPSIDEQQNQDPHVPATCESVSSLEQQSIVFTNRAIKHADLQLWCLPADAVETGIPVTPGGDVRASLLVITKADLASSDVSSLLRQEALVVSAKSGLGLDDLKNAIIEKLKSLKTTTAGVVAATAVRCQESLVRAAQAIRQAQTLVETYQSEELVASALRTALDELGQITGAVFVEDILDRIFSRFCIGK